MNRTRLILGAALSLALAGEASAAYNSYMKISTIPGEATRGGQGGWIELDSVQFGPGAPAFGSIRSGDTGKGGPGSVQFRRVRTFSIVDRTSFESKPLLGKVQVEVRKPGSEAVYYKIVLTDARVVPSSRGADQFPTETIKMTYGAIEWTWHEPKPPTSLQARPAAKP